MKPEKSLREFLQCGISGVSGSCFFVRDERYTQADQKFSSRGK